MYGWVMDGFLYGNIKNKMTFKFIEKYGGFLVIDFIANASITCKA